MAQVFFPPALRELTGGVESLEAAGRTVGELVEQVELRFPGFRSAVCQGERLRPGLAVVLNGSAATRGLSQPILEPVEVHFLPALGGG